LKCPVCGEQMGFLAWLSHRPTHTFAEYQEAARKKKVA
jgi:hypothetical protein